VGGGLGRLGGLGLGEWVPVGRRMDRGKGRGVLGDTSYKA